MKTIEIKLYKYSELSKEAKERAHADYIASAWQYETPWQSEIFESLKACITHAGYTLKHWNLGGSDNRGQGITLDFLDSDDLTGARAMAWLENVFLSGLRIPFTPYTLANGKRSRRADFCKNNQAYRAKDWKGRLRPYSPGLIEPAPFTGMCFDDSFIDCLRDSIKDGVPVRESLKGLADKYAELLDAERDSVLSLEYFEEREDAYEIDYLETGEEYL